MRRRPMGGHPAVNRTTLVRPQPSQLVPRSSNGRIFGSEPKDARFESRPRSSTCGNPWVPPRAPPSALCARSPPVDLRPRCLAQRSTRGRPGTSPTHLRTRTWCPSGLQHRRRGFDSFRPCSTCRRGLVSDDPNDPPCRSPMRPAAGIAGREARRGSAHARTGRRGPWRTTGSPMFVPRSSSRTGCRSLTPVMRVRVPPGVSMRPWCQVGSTRRCQRCGPGSSPGGRSSLGLLVATMVACNHPSGVRFPGAPLSPARPRTDPAVLGPREFLDASLVGACRAPPDPVTTRHYTLSDAPGGAARLSTG